MIELKQVDNPYEKQENWVRTHVDTFLSADLVVLPLTNNKDDVPCLVITDLDFGEKTTTHRYQDLKIDLKNKNYKSDVF
jgi:hypothetical protein